MKGQKRKLKLVPPMPPKTQYFDLRALYNNLLDAIWIEIVGDDAEVGIANGDILLVDRGAKPVTGDIVVWNQDGKLITGCYRGHSLTVVRPNQRPATRTLWGVGRTIVRQVGKSSPVLEFGGAA